MANVLYPNFVLENKLTNLLNTKLGVRSFMTIDTSLVASAGMIKNINTYTYTGAVEKLAKGVKNTVRGAVSYTAAPYTVKLAQQVFDYFDEDVLQDPLVIDMGMQGSATLMVNELNAEFFTEIAKTTVKVEYVTSFKYDDVVDAIALMNIEDESGLFLIVGNDLKAAIRKDTDFKAAQAGAILFNGQIGSIAGVPVVFSKLVPTGAGYLATKDAVTCYVKKESEVEQARDAEARSNTVILRRVNLVALTDATKAVKFNLKVV